MDVYEVWSHLPFTLVRVLLEKIIHFTLCSGDEW